MTATLPPDDLTRPATLDLAQLLDVLGHRPDEHVSICHKPPGGRFTSAVYRVPDAAARIPTGADVWFGVNPVQGPPRVAAGRGTADQVVRLAALYADLDVKVGGPGDMDTAAAVINDLCGMLGARPAAVTFSGHGLQPFWPLDEQLAGEEARALLRRFGRLVATVAQHRGGAVDPVYDLARVLRVPGTLNLKAEPVAVVTVAAGGRPLAVAEVVDALDAYGVSADVSRATAAGADDQAEEPSAAYDALPESLREWSDRYVDGAVRGIVDELRAAARWPDGYTDERGRGWEKLCADQAMALGQFARATWTKLTLAEARSVFLDAAPTDGSWTLDDLEEKWATQSGRGPAKPWPKNAGDVAARDRLGWEKLGVQLPPAPAPQPEGAASGDAPSEAVGERPALDVSNPAVAADWLRTALGDGPLAGMFARGSLIVHTPRIGEDGYVPLTDRKAGDDDDGPAQVHPVTADVLSARVQYGYRCVKWDGRSKAFKPALFPVAAARMAVNAVDLLSNLRPLRSITHTPMVRPDGTVLTEPGYDATTRVLHLPEPGLAVPPVPDQPTAGDVAAARGLLDEMTAGFPFLTEHDRANYYAALLTPLLRQLVPPPYKLLAIGAPQPGSGKSLLASVLRIVHGGVFRAETPEDDAELRKQISTILDVTTGPVVTFDNVSGVLRSSTLSGLLTSGRWEDRRLGSNAMVSRANDRLWTITGNNLLLGGDLVRRTLWVTIDPQRPQPEKRTGFAIPNLEAWAAEHRGRIIHALLTLVRAWVAAGRPIAQQRSSDGFARWIEAVDGILSHAGVPGTVDHADSARQTIGSDDDEWEDFLRAAHEVFGDRSWTARELLEKVNTREYPDPVPGLTEYPGMTGWNVAHPIAFDALPAALAEKINRGSGNPAVVAKALGHWLRNREGRWAGAHCVRSDFDGHTKVKRWRVEVAGFAGNAGFDSQTYVRDNSRNFISMGRGDTPQSPHTPQPDACSGCGQALAHFPPDRVTAGRCPWCQAREAAGSA